MDALVDHFDARRKEFGDFLRSRRERLTPAAVGLPNGFRRRTPGLRREEVALLTGVGTTWYTWLEQGRDVRPSAEVLNALAEALNLDPAERQHLFTLADRPSPQTRSHGPEQVPGALARMLASMAGQPAYVLGRRWDVLAWNAAAVTVFGDFVRLEGDARNMMHLMFVNEAHRRLLADWDDLAPLSLAMFRADSARYAGDPDFERLIAVLMKESPEFRAWWPRHDVVLQPSTVKRIRHPSAGQLEFEYMSLDVSESPGMRFVVCTPRQT
ncbi:helix-turn-helix transcriptional regulator [Pseudomonas aeruginosa]|uniref:helix-turn-helix transcriptional regulator n=1 Tax=Pseudomonas aeruginosa TaxID=287 RepID=UPI001F24BAA4|nr:helix-turn-helix transcriptional regulator [Pseudomonas aeruginosa]MCG0483787.1 helix-turn-helix transcriptional regulator [Pseudomonas aeruginosa]